MRRTFQDLARRAEVNSPVQRSICGHLTEEMTERHRSIASPNENEPPAGLS